MHSPCHNQDTCRVQDRRLPSHGSYNDAATHGAICDTAARGPRKDAGPDATAATLPTLCGCCGGRHGGRRTVGRAGSSAWRVAADQSGGVRRRRHPRKTCCHPHPFHIAAGDGRACVCGAPGPRKTTLTSPSTAAVRQFHGPESERNQPKAPNREAQAVGAAAVAFHEQVTMLRNDSRFPASAAWRTQRHALL